MSEKTKKFLKELAWIMLAGIGFGVLAGFLSPLSYSLAMGMCLGCALMIHVFQTLTEAYLYPRFKMMPRGKKLVLRQVSALLSHILGWILPIWITGMIVGFKLFQREILIWMGIFVAIVLIVHTFHQLVRFYRELRERDVLEEKLKALAAQAELKALRAQINPHFLFNSLNTIASLISTNPEVAEESVERLADIFRYALSASDKEFVPLADELEFIDSYLDIEKARFGSRLNVKRNISADVLDTPIPSLILQPLVENSVKHGIGQNGEVKLEIAIQTDNDTILISVRDEGRGVSEQVRKGIYTNGTGLRNVSERLRQVYGEPYGLKLGNNQPCGTLATVTIPRKRK